MLYRIYYYDTHKKQKKIKQQTETMNSNSSGEQLIEQLNEVVEELDTGSSKPLTRTLKPLTPKPLSLRPLRRASLSDDDNDGSSRTFDGSDDEQSDVIQPDEQFGQCKTCVFMIHVLSWLI